MSPRPPALAPFAFLWAFALLYHQVAYRYLLSSPLDTALGFAAVAVMLRPGSAGTLAVLAGLHVATVLHQLPQVSNHWYFGGMVSLGLVLAAVVAWRRDGRQADRSHGERLLSSFAPVGQVSLALVYGLSGLHKLNHDFFTPGISCASVLTSQAAELFRLHEVVPDPGLLVIWLTVVVELGLPVLLLVRRWRLGGILLALGFHLVMAAAGYPRFSATGVALLTLLLPAEAWQPWDERLERVPAAGRWSLRVMLPGTFLLVAWVGPPLVETAFLVTQAVLTLAVGALVLRAWRGAVPMPPAAARYGGWRVSGLAWVAPLLMIGVAAAPYLGLGTHRALSMYSNLRTEGGITNHFLFPASLQAFGFQRDLVAIEASNAAPLQRLADQELLVPLQELRALLTDALTRQSPTPVAVRYSGGGLVHEIPDAAADPRLGLPVSWGARLFLRFRPIEASGPRRCTV